MAFARTFFVVSLALWVGTVVFYSLVVLPVLFTRLEPARAGEIAALIFPAYYMLGTVCGLLLVATASYLALRLRGSWQAALAVGAVMLICQAYATFSLQPKIARIRTSASIEDRARFDALHQQSVRLNGVVLVGGLLLAFASGHLLGKR